MCREKNLPVPGMGTEDTIMYLLIVGEASEEITAKKPVIKQRGRCVDVRHLRKQCHLERQGTLDQRS